MLATAAPDPGTLDRHDTDLARVVTLTPAPAIDRVYVVDAVRHGEVNRASHVESFLAGKGINVSRALHTTGGETIAVTALSTRDAGRIDDPTPLRVVPVSAPARVNTVIVSRDGQTTNVNEAAPSLSARSWDQITAATIAEIERLDAHWLVIAGSFPLVSDTDEYPDPTELLAACRARGTRVCLDSGGARMRDWLTEGHTLDLVKPNKDELGDFVGRPLETVGDVAAAARELMDAGVGAVLASLGADGALLVTPERELWAAAPAVHVVNTTGAGDATLAGFLQQQTNPAALGSDAAALRRAVTWGARAVMEITTTPNDFSPLTGVVVDTPPYARVLTPTA